MAEQEVDPKPCALHDDPECPCDGFDDKLWEILGRVADKLEADLAGD